MKKYKLYIIPVVLCSFLGSCKSSQYYATKSDEPLVSIADFKYSSNSPSKPWEAVILNEKVDVRINSPEGRPWVPNVFPYLPFLDDRAWETTVEDKILLSTNNINDKSFSTIDYFYPRGINWNPMRKCDIWLYSLEKNSKIKKRIVKKDEIKYDRLNDSIVRLRLNIREDVSGKILVRKYMYMNPYFIMTREQIIQKYRSWNPYTGTRKQVDLPKFAKIAPWIFQKEIPLLYGKYEIRLPINDHYHPVIEHRIVKLGDGEIDVKNDERISEVKCIIYDTFIMGAINSSKSNITHATASATYKAKTYTATVSNVMPLPKGCDAQPLGIAVSILSNSIPDL